jgi:hypothetical protein
MKVSVLLFFLAVCLTSCTSIHTHRDPRVDLTQIKKFYVLHRLTDDHHMDEMIANQLRQYGREVSMGPMTMMPQDAEALVTYQDDWAWDFKTYLIQLRIEIRRAYNNQPLAEGTYRQPSIITKPPAVVIEKILKPLFAAP